MKGARTEKKKEQFPQSCIKCGYKWKSRTKYPKSCPNCKRYDWKK